MTEDHEMFRVGDIVTRDGTDLQRIVAINDAGDLIDVVCIQPSEFGWCKVGDTEVNVAWRYNYPDQLLVNSNQEKENP